MTFIPEGYVLLSEWLDGRARELFPAEYPPEIADDAVEAYIAERPLELDSVVAPSPSAEASFAQDSVAQLLDAETESPGLRMARAASQAELDRQLRELSDPTYRRARYRQMVRSDLERDRARAVVKLKLHAFENDRQQFYHGGLETIWVAADGSRQLISGHLWGADDAERLIATGLFQDRPILVQFSIHNSARSNTTAAADRCRRRLIGLMKASPDKKTTSKAEMIKAGIPQEFRISRGAFERVWADALAMVGPSIAKVWKRSGRLPKKSQRPIETPK
jgi:hypothetical protein